MFSWRNLIKALLVTAILAVFVTVLSNSSLISQSNEKIQNKQIQSLSRILIKQAALSSSDYVVNEEQDKLLKLAQQLTKDNLIFDVTVYNAEGIKLAASNNALTISQILGLHTPLSVANIGREQLIEPILHENNLVGFVRVTFEKSKLTAFANHHYRKSDRLMYSMLIMSLLCGMAIVFLFRRRASTPPLSSFFLTLKK
ncbi:YtjB family periplasmic protein [Aliivibrio kagoshimensis]|uniref:YtjB family periplasmic protein n=1 Tax=Aliivibrio kagoshimensis TaxID=2910230 RepID=UPI003D14D3CD